MTVPTTLAPVSPVRAGWVVSPTVDVSLLSGSALAVLAPWAWIQWVGELDPFVVIAIVAVGSNGPHLAATWTRAWLDARERREHPVAYLVVPALILGAILATGMSGRWGMRLLQTVVIVWATWHFAAQCYGILRIYQRKSGEAPRFAHRLEGWLPFAVGLTGLVWRLHFGPTRVFGYKVLLPDLPWEAVVACLLATLTLCFGLVVDRARTDVPLAGRRLLFLASVFVGFWVPFMLIANGSVAFAAAAGWHGLQYLCVVWVFSLHKHGGRPLVPGARLVGWVSQPGRAWAFAGLLLALAGSVYGLVAVIALALDLSFETAGALTWAGMTLGHYWLDGLIWKMRKPAVAVHLV